MRKLFLVSLVFLLVVSGCQRETEAPTETAATDTAPPPPPQPTVLSEAFQTPESVLYDPDQDVYFVSNINGDPLATDDNGYISRVNAETLQIEPKWIDGARPDVQLNAPKGMTIVGDELWVTDITNIRKFDRRTAAPRASLVVKGSSFLNDLASEGNSVYVSDSGLKSGKAGFEPTGTDAVWQLSGTAAKRFVSGKDLNRPNGLAASEGKIWMVPFGGTELFELTAGQKNIVGRLPQNSLDGLVRLGDGSFLVSSWDAKAVYRGSANGTFQPLIENVDAPADIGFDSKRNRVLVPHFMENRVTIHTLP